MSAQISSTAAGPAGTKRIVAAALSAWGLVLSSAPRERPTPPSLDIAPDVIEACRRGDRNALDVVFRAHAEILERLLARLVGPHADVEDLLQETFAQAIQAFPRFRGEASVRTWLHRIAVHIARHHLRQPRRRRDVPLDEHAETASAALVTDVPVPPDLARRLYEHLDALDPAKRIALVLYVIEERSIAEIAALMGASQAATKSRLFWARRALLRRLQRDPRFTEPRGDQGGEQ
jgi:RNA polymerase sigma-70 factor, ECF subfamily